MGSMNENPETMHLSDDTSLIIETNDEGIIYKASNRLKKSFTSLNKMQNQEMLCDVTLLADNTEVRAHKVILASSSLFFYTMFSSMSGLITMDRIVLDDIHRDALPTIIQYIYTAEIFVTKENVKYLLRAAKFFVLDEVFNACCHFLQAHLSIDNCLSIAAFARENDCLELTSQAEAFIEKHFTELVDSKEFLELPHHRVSEIIKSDKLNAPDETKVFTAVVAWIKHEIESRRIYLTSLMEFVRFPLMPLEDLIGKVIEDPLFENNPRCVTFMKEILKYHLTKDNQESNVSSLRAKPRQFTDLSKASSSTLHTKLMQADRIKTALVVVGQNQDSRLSLESYDFQRQQWREGPESFCRALGLGSSLLIAGEKIYLIGGWNKESRKVNMFDLRLKTWTECSQLLEGRNEAAATLLNGSIYVSGGSESAKTCERFDPVVGSWTKIADLQERRNCHGMCTLDGKIYVVGGNKVPEGFYFGPKLQLSSVELYSPKLNSWIPSTKMTTGRIWPGVAALDNKLYVIGGSTSMGSLKIVEVFNPITRSWTKAADMNVARSHPGVVVANGLIYVVGGYDGIATLQSVEFYDPRNNTWTMLPQNMNNGKFWACAAVVNAIVKK